MDATINVLETMAMVKVSHSEPYLKKNNLTYGDATGIISLEGDKIIGTMVLSFSKESILKIISNMLSEEFMEIDEDVLDAVGELTNMVSGGAKGILSEEGHTFQMTIPSLVKGRGKRIKHEPIRPSIVIPFSIDAGDFCVEACLKWKAD